MRSVGHAKFLESVVGCGYVRTVCTAPGIRSDTVEIRPVSSGSLLLVSEAARNTLKFDIFSRIRIMQIAKKQKELSTRAHLSIYVIRSDSVA